MGIIGAIGEKTLAGIHNVAAAISFVGETTASVFYFIFHPRRFRYADVGLAEAAEKMPNEISGGMKKRVAIARAMALDPKVIFLDEPSAGLDPITSSALDDLILKLRGENGTTFVVVTHELPSIFKIADRAAMFDRARKAMIALGSPKELMETSKDPFVIKFFKRGEN